MNDNKKSTLIIEDALNNSKKNKNSSKERKKFIDSAFFLTKSLNNTKIKRDFFSRELYEYYFINDLVSTSNVSDFLIKSSINQKDSINLGVGYRFKGFYFKNEKVFDSSFYYYLKAEKIYLKLNNQQELVNVLINKGLVQFNFGDFLGAELTFSKAYNIIKGNNMPNKKLYEVYNSLGNVSGELKEHSKAIEYYTKALNIILNDKDNIDQYQAAIIYNNLGFTYQILNEDKKSISNLNKGLLNKNLEFEFPELFANLTDNLAFSKFKTKDYSELPQLFYKSLSIRDSLKNLPSIILSKIHLSEYYFDIGDTLKAKKIAVESLIDAKKSKSANAYLQTLQNLSAIDKKNASIYTKDYIIISDSIQIADRKNLDRFARIQLETDELRAENFEITARNKEVFGYFVIFFIVGGMLFYTRLQRMKIREESLKLSQKSANEEIYRLIIDHQNKLEEGKELEKKRISQELHDGILGRIFGLRLNLDGLNNSNEEEDVNLRMDYLNELKLIEQDLREISHDLNRENLVVINNFVAIIDSLIETQSKNNKAIVHSKITQKVNWDVVSNIRKINIYRIIQESLQNINKYAFAKNITITLKLDKKLNLILTIVDDGVGYDANNKKHNGIGTKNILERTKQCNGKIEIDSTIGNGTNIFITFPPEIEPKTTTDAPNY